MSKLISVLFLLLPAVCWGKVSLEEVSRKVRGDKQPFFAELARIEREGPRYATTVSRAMARLVVCEISSGYAEQTCLAMESGISSLAQLAYDTDTSRIRLRAAGAALRSSKASLSGAGNVAADSLILEMGSIMARSSFEDSDRIQLLNSMRTQFSLWQEFQSPALVAYKIFWAQFRGWLERGSRESSLSTALFKDVACAVVGNGVRCTGNNINGQLNVPRLSHPTQVAVGATNACAIDDSGLRCWGKGLDPNTLGEIRNPVRVAMHDGYGCVLDDLGKACWMQGATKLGRYSDLSATEIAVYYSPGGGSNCWIENGKVGCSGNNFVRDLPRADLKNPRNLAIRYEEACVEDAEGVKCWQNGKKPAYAPQVPLTKLRGWYLDCDTRGPGLNCDSELARLEKSVPSHITHPDSFSLAYAGKPGIAGCALQEGKVKCWSSAPDPDGLLPAIEYAHGFSAPKFFSLVTGGHYCASDGTEYRCSNFEGSLRMKNVQELYGSRCLRDEEGVHCWDSYPRESYSLPPDAQLSSSFWAENRYGKSCWIGSEGVKCGDVGKEDGINALRPVAESTAGISFKNPKMIDDNCALDEEFLKCWSAYYYDKKPPQLASLWRNEFENPKKLVRLTNLYSWGFQPAACVLDGERLRCFSKDEELPVPVSSAKDFAVERSILAKEVQYVCAVGDYGTRCWSYPRSNN